MPLIEQIRLYSRKITPKRFLAETIHKYFLERDKYQLFGSAELSKEAL